MTVTRTGGSEGTVTVRFATADGTAMALGDYAAASGVLSFVAGVTTRSFTVPIVSDSFLEPEETFTITLSDPTGGATLGAAAATINIAAQAAAAAVPTASSWMLIALAAGLAAVTLLRLR